jgi:hypothetical protein
VIVGAFDRAYEGGRDAGIREAIALILEEPNFEGPMPWRNWLRSFFRPEFSARAAGAAWRASVVRKLRARLDEEIA